MKKLLILFAMAIGSNSYSQSIENTVWKTYSTLFSDTIEVTFGTDSMHQNGSSLGFIVSSIYKIHGGDTVSFWDIGGNSTLGCAASDTGIYRAYGFTSDTLTLILINDDCANRGTSYNGVVFWNTYRPSPPPTGISDNVEENPISIFPNPSNGIFTVFSNEVGHLNVYSVSGGTILTNQLLKKGNNQIELPENTSSGLYILRFTTEQRVWTKRHTISIE